jgi:hypothetical protein
MNRHPQTATDDPLVAACSLCSLAVSGCRKRKIPARLQELQLQIEVFICRNPQKEHHERIQIPSTEIPSGQQDRLSGVRQESLLHPLYRRGGRFPSPAMWASATTSTVAATTIRPKNISGTILPSKRGWTDTKGMAGQGRQ